MRKFENNADMPGVEVYSLARAETNVRIADALIKSVGFVSRFDPASDGGANVTFGGTAFTVGIEMEPGTRCGLAHLVTAKHVADAVSPAEAIIAMNAKDGEALYLRTGDAKWFYHPTEPDSVDVAVIPFGSARFSDYDIVWVSEELFCTDETIQEFDIGLGDELVIIGLFTRFFGSTRLTPIVRTGNLAMMPRDKIPTTSFGQMEAYLAEGRSIGGLSGSPVFVRNTVKFPMQSQRGIIPFSGLGAFHLLGSMHGHWDVPTSFSSSEQTEAVNMGVSIVVPAKKILETLYHPELVAMRKEQWDKQKATPTSPKQDADFDSKTFTRIDFENALHKASRKLSDQK